MGSGEEKWKQRERSLGGSALSPPTSLQDSGAIRHRGRQQRPFLCFTRWSSLPSPRAGLCHVPAIASTAQVPDGEPRLPNFALGF